MTTTERTEADVPKIISVDDHIVEPPDLWQSRLASKWLEVGPRVVQANLGQIRRVGGVVQWSIVDEGDPCDLWRYEDLTVPLTRLNAAAGFPREELTWSTITYDTMRPGAWQLKPRLEDMDENWTEASVCFPTFPRFCGQTFLEAKDRELALLCVLAYNDWMVEEWAEGSGGRLVPLCLIPLWDAALAADEVRRNAARGVRAVAFSEIPPYLGLPSIHHPDRPWDPFFEACQETATVVCMHIGSSSKLPSTSADAPSAVTSALTHVNASLSLVDFLFSGTLTRFPRLRLAYSEGQIGWVPFILERCDAVWRDLRAFGDFGDNVPEPPSTYFHRQVYGCFFDDEHGLRSIDEVGEDNITYETDYPHADGNWPNARSVVHHQTRHLTDEQQWKVVRGNAIRLFGLPLAR